MCHLLSPLTVGSFFIASLNSQDLGHQVRISTGGFYLLFHNFCTQQLFARLVLAPSQQDLPVGTCRSRYQHLSVSYSLPVQKAALVTPGNKYSGSLMLVLSDCGENWWSMREGDESMTSNRSRFAELYQLCLATLALFLGQS